MTCASRRGPPPVLTSPLIAIDRRRLLSTAVDPSPLPETSHGRDPAPPSPPSGQPRQSAVRRAIRARRVRRRVRRRCRRPVARPGPAAGAGRAGGAGPPWRLRCRRRDERWRGRCPAAGSVPPRADRRRRRRPRAPPSCRVFLPRAGRSRAASAGARRGDLRPSRAPGRPLARRPDRRRGPRGRRRCLAARPSPRPSSAARTAAADDARPISDEAFETAPGHRPPPARDRRPRSRRRALGDCRPVRLGSDDRLQGPGPGRPPARPVPGPAGAAPPELRRLPPALRHEHPSGLAAGPAVPPDLAQRRDQHRAGQPRGDPRPGRGRHDLPGRPRPAGGRAAPVARRLGLAVARRGARAADGDRLGSHPGPADRDPGGARPPPRPASARRDPASPDGRVPGRRGMGRPRSSSPTAGVSGRWSTATGCGRPPSP